MDALETAFSETTRIVLGQAMPHLYEMEKWLARHVALPHVVKSMKSGKEVWMPPGQDFLGKNFSPHKIISMDEGELNPPSPFKAEELEGADLASIRSRFIKPLAVFWGNFRYKTVENAKKSSGCGDCVNVYYSEDVYHGARNVAYCKSVLYSENMFGCMGTNSSKYCIDCYNSIDLTRCFEVDACTKCSDCYFCHNCENVENGLFCFNVKGMRYAIGNVEVGREKFMQVKKMVLEELAARLMKEKTLGIDIYSIGSAQKVG